MAGIEHFANSNKSTMYGSVVSKSCLKKFTGFGYLNYTGLSDLKAGNGTDSWLSITIIGHCFGLL